MAIYHSLKNSRGGTSPSDCGQIIAIFFLLACMVTIGVFCQASGFSKQDSQIDCVSRTIETQHNWIVFQTTTRYRIGNETYQEYCEGD